MPLFDYECPHCGTTQELILKTPKPGRICPCGGLMALKVSRPNFELKGEGWYKDGYK